MTTQTKDHMPKIKEIIDTIISGDRVDTMRILAKEPHTLNLSFPLKTLIRFINARIDEVQHIMRPMVNAGSKLTNPSNIDGETVYTLHPDVVSKLNDPDGNIEAWYNHIIKMAPTMDEFYRRPFDSNKTTNDTPITSSTGMTYYTDIQAYDLDMFYSANNNTNKLITFALYDLRIYRDLLLYAYMKNNTLTGKSIDDILIDESTTSTSMPVNIVRTASLLFDKSTLNHDDVKPMATQYGFMYIECGHQTCLTQHLENMRSLYDMNVNEHRRAAKLVDTYISDIQSEIKRYAITNDLSDHELKLMLLDFSTKYSTDITGDTSYHVVANALFETMMK